MTTCTHDRTPIAGWLLGGLDADERDAVARQVEACDECRAEAQALEPLIDTLALARRTPVVVPGRLRDRVLVAATRRKLRRRWVALTTAAALTAAVLGGAVGYRVAVQPAQVSFAVSAQEPFSASGIVGFVVDDRGAVLTIELDDVAELDDPGAYEAWLYRTDGRIESIGQLNAVDGRITAQLRIEGPLDQFRTFWITAEPDRRDPAHAGPTVVRTAVPQIGTSGT